MRHQSTSIFFFQAEDGIRDYKVTGVQTCALPICAELLEADPRQLVAHRLHEAGVVHGDVNARHIPRILKDSASSITMWGMGSGTMRRSLAFGAAVAALAAALVLVRLDLPPVPTWF